MKPPLNVTPLSIAMRYLGLREVPGKLHNPMILAMNATIDGSIHDDETPWCSTFANHICWILALPRSNSRAARSWLRVGHAVPISLAEPGFHVAVLRRGGGNQPGPEVLAAPGHVGFVKALTPTHIELVGGNQGDAVSIASFPRERVLGIREL